MGEDEICDTPRAPRARHLRGQNFAASHFEHTHTHTTPQ